MTQRIYNFSAGPATLPVSVLQQIQDELMNWRGTGASIMELSHRDKPFMAMAEACEALVRELLAIPKQYRILFLAGGATMQFSGVPLNLLSPQRKAGYIISGFWSKKACHIAKAYGEIDVLAEVNEQDNPLSVPYLSDVSPDYAYVYYTHNETINGLQYYQLPVHTDVPIVCDMTSSIMSEPINMEQYGIIFASAQKNLGQAGITLVIIRDDLMGYASPLTPTVIDYAKQASEHSMLNTPPTFAWYVCYLMLQWIANEGGVAAMAAQTQAKAQKIYACLDAHDLYEGMAHPDSRSQLNTPFRLVEPDLEARFLAEASAQGFMGLKGHRLIGGIRPSIYLGMPMAGVDALVDFMNAFAQNA